MSLAEAFNLSTTGNPRYFEGQAIFTAPWRVASWVTASGETVHSVWSEDSRVVIQPGCHSLEFCEAVVRSRNEGTREEDIAYIKAREAAAIRNSRDEVDRVRAHFQAELSRVLEANSRLQDAIVEARRSGSVGGLPAWCQPSDDLECREAEASRLRQATRKGKRRKTEGDE